MPFSTMPVFGLNRSGLPRRIGILRLIAILATIVTLAQWIVPVGARYIFNGGRIYYPNEYFNLWGPILPWPVLSVPAWLTITTGLIAIGCASAYLLLGGLEIADDVAYMTLVPLLAGYVTIFIAAFEKDSTGVIWTPGADGYPIGWHWIVAPFTIVLIASGIIASVRMKRLRAERRRRRAERHVAQG